MNSGACPESQLPRPTPYLRYPEGREGGEYLPTPGMARSRLTQHHPDLCSPVAAEWAEGDGADEFVSDKYFYEILIDMYAKMRVSRITANIIQPFSCQMCRVYSARIAAYYTNLYRVRRCLGRIIEHITFMIRTAKKYFTLLLCFIAILFTGCSTGAPAKSFVEPAMRLPATDDIRPSADQNFALSPDGHWISYMSENGNAFQPAYVLYSLDRQERVDLTLSASASSLASQGFGPPDHAGCWGDNSSRLIFPNADGNFVVNVGLSTEVDAEKESLDARRALEKCPQSGELQNIPVRVEQQSRTEASIVSIDDPSRVIVTHKGAGLFTTDVLIPHVMVSPDGKWLAYTIAEAQGTFAAPLRGYLVPLTTTAQPQLLSAGVFGPLRWSFDGLSLYGCVRDNSEMSIYQWKITP